MKKLLVILFAWFSFMGLALAGTPVDLNTANQAQLESVKGIGPAKAKAILEYRAKSGPFKSVDDLDNIKGFGKKSIDKMRSEITVGGGARAADVKPAEVKAPDTKASSKAVDVKAATPAAAEVKAPDTKADKAAEKAKAKADKAAEKAKAKADKASAKATDVAAEPKVDAKKIGK